jgi:hypothetical protein
MQAWPDFMLLEKISKKYAANIGISVFAAFICCQTREEYNARTPVSDAVIDDIAKFITEP